MPDVHLPKAVFFGAIGSIAETSDLQRQGFNAAFAEAGLDWHWSLQEYCELLRINGGQTRLHHYRDADPARRHVTDSTIEKLHSAKTGHYVQLLAKGGAVKPRPGVAALVSLCLAEK